MLTNYARWYSFTPPQWPTLSPPLTINENSSAKKHFLHKALIRLL